MEVHLSPEKEAKLQELALRSGKNAAQVLAEVVDHLLDDEIAFRAAVRDGIAAIDRGEYLEEEEMNARIKRLTQV